MLQETQPCAAGGDCASVTFFASRKNVVFMQWWASFVTVRRTFALTHNRSQLEAEDSSFLFDFWRPKLLGNDATAGLRQWGVSAKCSVDNIFHSCGLFQNREVASASHVLRVRFVATESCAETPRSVAAYLPRRGRRRRWRRRRRDARRRTGRSRCRRSGRAAPSASSRAAPPARRRLRFRRRLHRRSASGSQSPADPTFPESKQRLEFLVTKVVSCLLLPQTANLGSFRNLVQNLVEGEQNVRIFSASVIDKEAFSRVCIKE